MKISVDGVELLTLTETQKKILQHSMHKDTYVDSIKNAIKSSLIGKYKNCFERLKFKGEPILKNAGVEELPFDHDELARKILDHPAYKKISEKNHEIIESKSVEKK